MKVGSLFSYRHNGKHDDCTLVILPSGDKRVVYNIDYDTVIGCIHILSAKYTGKVASKKDIEKYCAKI